MLYTMRNMCIFRLFFLLLSCSNLVTRVHTCASQRQVGARFNNPNCQGKQAVVHLFEWSWKDVGRECQEYLGPKGFCGVQVSPPNEHILGTQWWTRYQPVSYKLESRSGNRLEFIDMVNKCNQAGVNVVVDLVINHMSALSGSGKGIGNSDYNGPLLSYPGVPYDSSDFHHPYCEVDLSRMQNVTNVRNCYLLTLNDLNGSKVAVRKRIASYIQDLVDIGVKGFRVDAAKHMWPLDLEAILHDFQDILVYNEVLDFGGEPIHASDYYGLGKVTEFKASLSVACIKSNHFSCLQSYAKDFGDPQHSLVFVDNHDNQRGHSHDGVLNYKDGNLYKMATAFLLSHPFGFKRIMSSYQFNNTDAGPPLVGPKSVSDGDCGNGWVCEHRWPAIGNLVKFANVMVGTDVTIWQVAEKSLSFSRGNVGFVAIGNHTNALYQTHLANDGHYKELVSGAVYKVQDGFVQFGIIEEPVVALCQGC